MSSASSISRISRRGALSMLGASAALGTLAVLGGGLGALGCKQSDGPAEPVWGKEPCAHCKMLVSDKRYAAQIVDDSGEHRFFDDIGCMVLWTAAHSPAARAWVRDSSAATWGDARSSRYMQGARTPMNFGFEARSDGPLGFEAMRDAVLERKRSSR